MLAAAMNGQTRNRKAADAGTRASGTAKSDGFLFHCGSPKKRIGWICCLGERDDLDGRLRAQGSVLTYAFLASFNVIFSPA
jgi:hypothetical protein